MGKELRQKSLMGRIYSTVTANKVLSAIIPAAITLSMKVRLAKMITLHYTCSTAILRTALGYLLKSTAIPGTIPD